MPSDVPERPSPQVPLRRLLREAVRLILTHHRAVLLALLTASILHAWLHPMQGAVIKKVVDGLSGKKGDSAQVVLGAVPYYMAVLAGLTGLSFIEKIITKGFYNPAMTIVLQREYLARRAGEDLVADVSVLQYDCLMARKALEVFSRDIWDIAAALSAIFVVQKALAPAWIPALLLVMAPLCLVSLVLAAPIRSSTDRVLSAVTAVARHTGAEQHEGLREQQSILYERLKRRESWMTASEVLAQFIVWLGCLAMVLLAAKAPGVIVPAHVQAGELALFLVNAQLLSRPLLEMSKAYHKFWSSEPALARVLFPAGGGSSGT